jgi:hypothetical protein
VAVKAVRQAKPSDWGQTVATLMGWMNPAILRLYPGQSSFFYSSLGNVTYTLSPAGKGTITAQGVYTAPTSFTEGQQVTITAKDVGNPLRRQIAIVTLRH